MNRPTWDEYFRQLARAVSKRSTCCRRKVGAVIVKNKQIVSTGYNGGPSGYPHCEDGACPRALEGPSPGYSKCIAIHAEANAILHSSPSERNMATLYCTDSPCWGCAKLIANSGIYRLIAPDPEQPQKDFLIDSKVIVDNQ